MGKNQANAFTRWLIRMLEVRYGGDFETSTGARKSIVRHSGFNYKRWRKWLSGSLPQRQDHAALASFLRVTPSEISVMVKDARRMRAELKTPVPGPARKRR